ncbi:hypothetical protein CVT26_009867 [Gymnopilus dilepis]|uniref:Uncharacterized protein n=1 Tax=Gymnopilus dilepis TaxID=231916 RepID=A0A409YC67_9AGAR|nr:hypothetical protein CVT26_009867 [Gymnopilus dilepis]
MASASTKQLSQKLTAIAGTWTKDPFRPNLQLQNFLKSLAAHPRLTPQAYPMSQKMLRPASSPLYYERLVTGFEKSAQGVGRPWWKVFFGIW